MMIANEERKENTWIFPVVANSKEACGFNEPGGEQNKKKQSCGYLCVRIGFPHLIFQQGICHFPVELLLPSK